MAKKKTTKGTKRRTPAAKTRPVRQPARRRGERVKVPAKQGMGPKRADVGYGRPPVEHQFQPGESGNPAGPPRARTNLWPYLCSLVGMLEHEVLAVQQDKSQPLARRTAAKQALQLWRKGILGVGLPFTIYVINREEGRPTQHVQYDGPGALTPEECEEIRKAMGGQR